MRELLRFEFFKLKRSVIFYVLGGIMLLLIVLEAATYYLMFQLMQELYEFELPLESSAELFSLGFLDVSSFVIICIIFSSSKALDDVRGGTMKNIISKGYTRGQIYFAKYLISLFAVLFYAVVCAIFSFLVGLIFFGNAADYRVEYFFLGMLAITFIAAALHSLFFGVASLLGKLPGAIIFNLLGFALIFAILGLMLINVKNFDILNYMPLSLADFTAASTKNGDVGQIFINLAVALGYAGLGIGVGYLGSKGRQY